MSLSIGELTSQALTLSSDERALLAGQLWQSIAEFSDTDIERAWLDIAEKRWKEIEQGNVQCIRADETMRRARAKLKKN